MKKNRRKIIVNAVLFFSVFGLTLYGVFHGEDLGDLQDAIGQANLNWLLPALLCVFAYIYGEAVLIWYMLRSYGIKIRQSVCFLLSSVGYFFSCITPSASGGQPMEILFLKKRKVPIPVSTVILMIITIVYKSVLVCIGLGISLFARGFLHKYLGEIRFIFYLGLLLNILTVAGMILLVFRPSLAKSLLIRFFRFLEKVHILKHKEGRLAKLELSMDMYDDTSRYMKEHPRVIVNVSVITLLQRIALFSVTYFVYRSFGLRGISPATIIILQASISVAVDMLPLPGGMGISENLFLSIFPRVFGEFLLPGMVLSRGLSYYSELIISAVFTLLAVAVLGRSRKTEI